MISAVSAISNRKKPSAASVHWALETTLLMKGIYTTSVSRETLDESPMAYKPVEDILSQIGPTAEVLERLIPVYNFKAGED